MGVPENIEEINDPLRVAEEWLKQGRQVALATVIETWGSAPRPPGSHLVVDADGNFQGSVSGGCVEGAVVSEALDVIAAGSPKLLEFGVTDETAWQVGLSCGGRIRVHVRKIGAPEQGNLETLNAARLSRRTVLVATDLADGTNTLLRQGDAVDAAMNDAVEQAHRTGRSRSVEVGGKTLFLNAYVPQPRLVVVGAVHITQALVPMARLAGYPVEIVDPRSAFATPERFPNVPLYARWPQDVLRADVPLDSYTALAAVTHDPKIDDVAVRMALEAGCFYVGALGSRKTHAARVGRLTAAGLSAESVARVSSPIGLNIAAANPAEIAVAILAEVIQSFRLRGLQAWDDAA